VPWTWQDARRHQSDLTPHQAVVWARVANSARRACVASGGSAADCDGKAIRQANAVAKRAPAKSVKLADDGALEILAIPFSGPIDFGDGKGRDSDGEYFSERTDLCLSWFPTHRPLLYHHGLDDDLQVEPIGKVDVTTAKQDEAGWWLRAQVDRSNRYWADIAALIDDDRMYASSGAMPHLVKRNKDGEITRWPWVELSLTTSPANLFATVAPAEAAKHYKAAGMTPPPILDDDAARPYIDLLDRLTDDSVEFIDLTRRLAEGRTKVGRSLSRRRRDQLLALADQWETGARDLRQIVAEAETAPKPEARAEGGADEGDPAAPSGDAPAKEQQPAEGDGGAEKAAAHAPSDVRSIFEQFQKDQAFYASVLTTQRR
jgi:hypothetical protein